MIFNGMPAGDVLDRSTAVQAASLSMDLLRQCRERIEQRLPLLLETGTFVPPQLAGAMRYALLSGGKRIRPLLLMLMAGPDVAEDAVLDVGCAIEMMHTASLILDDLPCMDDALTRRKRATTHIKFGQSTAILAAISLLTRSLSVISALDEIPSDIRARLVGILSDAVGQAGLAAGQELDVSGTSKPRSRAEVEQVNWLKTGKLFAATAEMAGILGARSPQQRKALVAFAEHLGAAFQMLDDMLDATASADVIGKDVGKDGNKQTVVSLLGITVARRSWEDRLVQAEAALVESGVNPEPIRVVLHQCFDGASPSASETVG